MQGAVVASTPKVIPGQSMAPIQEKCKTSIATINGALDSLKANQEVLCLSNNKCLVKRNWCLGLSFGGGFVSLGGSIGILFVAITSSIFWPLVLVTAGIAIIASALGAIGVSYNFKLNDLSEEIKGNNENIRFRESRAGHNEVRMQIEHEERKSDVSHDFSQICPYSLTNGLAEKGEGVFRRDVLRGASNVYSLKIEGEALSFRYEGEGVARPLFINFLNDFYDNLYSDIGSLVNQLQVDSGENLTIDNAVEYDSEIDAHRLYVNYDRVIQSMSDKKDSLEMLFAAWKTQDPEFCESEGVKGSMDAILETFNTALTMTQDSSNSKIVILRKIDKISENSLKEKGM